MDNILTTSLIALFAVIFAWIGAYFGARQGYKINVRKRRSRKYTSAALDKRLDVHQKAFSLSLQLPSAAENPEGKSKFLHDCDKFWKNNCLFMVPQVRESFRLAYQTAWIFPTYKDQYMRGEINEKQLNEKWHKITRCTYHIVDSIGFRWLGDLEPISKEGNYQRRAEDWQDSSIDRRRRF